MSEAVRALRFQHFRGLPACDFKLKGKNLVILGANGKGKSAVIDGIEFLFSGKVSRFIGAGTGSIDHDDAIQHVKKLGVPRVVLSLSPSNGEISRTLDASDPTVTSRDAVQQYFARHPRVDAFILRRAKILDFVCDQDADRYRKIVQLLGLTHVDALQRAFVDAERQAKDAMQRTRIAHATQLGVFRDPVEKFEPQNLGQVLVRISNAVHALGLPECSQWSEAESRLPLLKAQRPETNRERINSVTKALISIETPLPVGVGEEIETAKSLRQKLADLRAASADAPRSEIITKGASYLREHDTETNCPLCEAPFEQPLAEVLNRLEQRSEALRELQDLVAQRRSTLSRIERFAEGTANQLRRDLEHHAQLDESTEQVLRDALASALRWLRPLRRTRDTGDDLDVVAPPRLAGLAATRSACAGSLGAEKAALVPPDASKLEGAIALLERGIASHATICSAESGVDEATELYRRATVANAAFSAARETGIQKVFDRIAETVLDFYRRLHDFDEPDESSECTALELKPTSRAATGGVRLAIQFLGLANSKDPRAFLSEGHLDSLGLCLFLAAVRIFNPPGSLLVLDDVLTSIDRAHRRRVGELLFQEFSGYQVLLTTHDEHWHDLLHSSARARGTQENWHFIKLENWTVDAGPALSLMDSSWEFVTAHLTESDYRELGGPFRLILEDFLKRTAVKLELRVRFKIDGKYTAGDFVTAGIQDTIRDSLITRSPADETDICTDVARVFGQGDLVNFLSHDNPGRLEVTFDQATDFVRGLRDLTKRCEEHKLIRGR